LGRVWFEAEEAGTPLAVADLFLKFGLFAASPLPEELGFFQQKAAQAPFGFGDGDFFWIRALFGRSNQGAVGMRAGFANGFWLIDFRLFFLRLVFELLAGGQGMAEVLAGDAKDHGQSAGATDFHPAAGDGLGQLREGELDGVWVFERRQLQIGCGFGIRTDAVYGVEIAEVMVPERGGLAPLSIGENMPAFVIHRAAFLRVCGGRAGGDGTSPSAGRKQKGQTECVWPLRGALLIP
jgi:hypothetical protein